MRFTLVLFIAAVAVTSSPPSRFEAAAKGSQPYYCESRPKPPPGCVPKVAKRKPHVRPNQKPTVQPPETRNGGGVGGDGDGEREQGAIDWAGGFTGSPAWSYRDSRFVETAYAAENRPQFASARHLRRHVFLHKGSPASAPLGTLMFFRADQANRRLGHVGLSQGNGTMLSALDVVRRTDVVNVPYWNKAYLGWSHAPRRWPGRLPVPFNLLGPIDADSALIQRPAIDEVVRGPVRIEATAPAGALVEFAAYYSDDPPRLAPAWHGIGPANPIGMRHLLEWNTATVADQGSPDSGTVTIAAITVDAAGNPQGVGDYRRVTVDNVP